MHLKKWKMTNYKVYCVVSQMSVQQSCFHIWSQMNQQKCYVIWMKNTPKAFSLRCLLQWQNNCVA